MIPILTPEEMRIADLKAIEYYGISGSLLMENAARCSADFIRTFAEKNNKVIVFCGSGNNGGDGFALARHLSNDFNVMVYYIGDLNKMSPETKLNFDITSKLVIIEYLFSEEQINSIDLTSDIIIDALIGIGGSHNLKGLIIPILKKCNSHMQAVKIAIDCPTGLNSLSGEVSEYCFKADYTITMYAPKIGMFFGDAPEFCGKIITVDLGAPRTILSEIAKNYVLEDEDINKLLPRRKRISSKFDYGKLLIMAGSKNMPGASALTANSAIKSGAGLVYLMTPTLHPSLLPEIIPISLPMTDSGTISMKALDCIFDYANNCDVIAIGPGIGDNQETIELTKKIIDSFLSTKKIIVDADAIKAISKDKKYATNLIITPHTGEFARLINIERSQLEKNPLEIANHWAQKMNCIIHLKYVPSITTDGNISYINTKGNPGMATAGSGDVLTGIITSLSAQCLELLMAVALGSYIHSKAGDLHKENYSQFSLTASSLINCLDQILP